MNMKKTKAMAAVILTVLTALFSSAIGASAMPCKDGYTEAALPEDVRVSSRILEFIFGKGKAKGEELKSEECALLCPGGDIFGMRLKEGRVTVINSSADGVLAGDILTAVNGKSVKTVDEVKEILRDCPNKDISLEIMRGGESVCVRISPEKNGEEYKLGLSLRDGAAGIGTVTFYEPKTGFFGGLGHGICSAESQEPIKMTAGCVTGVILGGVGKGQVGKPGELCGVLTNDTHGTLYLNCECGVFGKLDSSFTDGRAPVSIAHKDEVHEGEATIISTVKNGKKAEYSVKLYDIDKTSAGTKSFKVKVTDEALLAMTGGIVRGMSGSPIIQDGKLVGAVTHVMVADPTEGYGIFIENMLSAAQNQVQPKAA